MDIFITDHCSCVLYKIISDISITLTKLHQMNKKLLADSKLVFQRCPGIQITFNSTSKLSSTKLLFLFGRFPNYLNTKDAETTFSFKNINICKDYNFNTTKYSYNWVVLIIFLRKEIERIPISCVVEAISDLHLFQTNFGNLRQLGHTFLLDQL